ncbi:unnamed protein product, partial [Schistosoma turkestanicum]
AIHNYQNDEVIVKQMESFIHSIHHQPYDQLKYYKIDQSSTLITSNQFVNHPRSMINSDRCEMNADYEQNLIDTNESWNSGGSNWNNNNNDKNYNNHLLLLISSIKRNQIDSFEWGCLRCFILLNS